MKIADLCCGLGGWVIPGHRYIGFDVERIPYPRELVLADVRTLDGNRFKNFDLIVASPPCTQFSKMLLLHGGLPKNPDLSVVRACFRIAKEAGVPIVLENTWGLTKFIGPAVAVRGSRYLWGDVPLMSKMKLRPKIGGSFHPDRPSHRFAGWADRDRSPRGARLRAKIEPELARAIIEPFTYALPNVNGEKEA